MRTFFYSVILSLLTALNGYADDELQETFKHSTETIIQKTCNDIVQQYAVRIGALMSQVSDVVRGFPFIFQTIKPISIETGRRLIVESTEIFLNNINGPKETRPVLAEFPFPVKRVSITFSSVDPQANRLKTGKSLAEVRLVNGMITYSKADREGENLIAVHSESFEEALAIIQKEKEAGSYVAASKTFSTNRSETKKSLSYVQQFFRDYAPLFCFYDKEKYCGPDYEKEMAWALDKFACTLAQKHQLHFFRVGDFTDAEPYHYYGFSFTSSKNDSLEEGRVLGATLFEELRNALYTLPEVEKCRRTSHDECKKKTPYAPTPDLQHLCFKVVFWDKNVDHVMPPHLAQIWLQDKVLSYYEADPKTQELRLVYQEPYEDALSFKNKSQ
jgi:hypothetical protein